MILAEFLHGTEALFSIIMGIIRLYSGKDFNEPAKNCLNNLLKKMKI